MILIVNSDVTVAALRFPRPFGRADRATSSKPARFIRHWRRFADFPSRGRPQGSPLRKRYMGCGTKSAGGVEPRPYGGLQEVRWAGRRGRRPLRKGCMGCGRRATARVAPTKGLHGGQWAGDRKGRPYEGLQEVTACGGGLLHCIRGAFCSARRYYGPPGPRFGPGRDRR